MSGERPVAVITGAGSGIGRETAGRLLTAGWRTVIADVNADSGARAAAELAASSAADRVAFCRTDVSQEADVEATIARALETFGRLDCMVNNAGFRGAFGPITELEVEDWDATFAVLSRGVFLGTKHAAPAMREAGGGSIVNVASIAALAAGVGLQAYSAAKAAVLSLTETTAVELAPDRIRVNAVSPGIVMTPLASKVKNLERGLRKVQPWPAQAQPSHIAEVIEFLTSPRAEFMTGANVVVDGGTMAAGPRLMSEIGSEPGTNGMVGFSYGNSGRQSLLRRRHLGRA